MAAIAAASLIVPTVVGVGPVDADDHAEGASTTPTYTVTFTNLTEGQYFTPPNWAAHSGDVEVFERNEEASPGVQAVAENGGTDVLAAELAAAVDDTGNGVSGFADGGPISPGSEVAWSFTTEERHFSLVSMIICTNDGFGGIDTMNLPANDGQSRTYRVNAYDAGTELNTERWEDLVPAPFCGGGGLGTGESNPDLAQNSKIRGHRGIRGVGDLGPSFDFPRGGVAEVTITRNDPTPVYRITVENLTTGQYLTPPNVAIHDSSVSVFNRFEPASPGVRAVAENGGVPVLAAELQGAVDDAGLGGSTVGGPDLGPIGPGGTRSFVLEADGQRLSLVAMVVCTNDGFAGLDSLRFQLDRGDSRTFYANSYDAGTEINTERNEDIVPAPFCGGEGVGTDVSNPALAQNSVIRPHPGIAGIGDLGPEFDWDDPVAKVTIERL